MKKILGLDIGTTSVAWAIIEATDEKKIIDVTSKCPESDINNDRLGLHKDAIGVRIISQDTERFDKGQTLNDPKGSTLTPTANRRKYRSSRRMKSRYKLRRDKLSRILDAINMTPDQAYYTNQKGKRGINNDIGNSIYKLRYRAIKEKISINELGRILLHLNQWRGYSSDRFAKDEKPKFDYHLVQVLEVYDETKLPIFDEINKGELKYYKISVKIKFDEPYNLGDAENKNLITELSGVFFKKIIDFKKGDFITIKNPEFKQDKKGKTVLAEYYKITPTNPDPTDWNYKYQALQKTLSEWCTNGGTVGEYFYKHFYETQSIQLKRIRNQVVNRSWYEDEFNKILDLQFEYHKSYFHQLNIEEIVKVAFKDYQPILTDILKKEGIKEQFRFLIKDKIIFFQRPWQQAKNKGQCLFEKIKVKKETSIKGAGKKEIIEEHIGRTVIPRSHPLFQEFKIWQQINNTRIFVSTPQNSIDLFSSPKDFKTYVGITIPEAKQLLYEALQQSKTLSWKAFSEKELGLKPRLEIVDTETGELITALVNYNYRKEKKDGTYEDIKLKGNNTKILLQNILGNKDDAWFNELHSKGQPITNLQFLWEIIYDITNSDACKVAAIIKKHFSFEETVCLQLANLKFDDTGMGNLSAKAIRQILPLMNSGLNIPAKTLDKINSLITLNNSLDEITKGKDEKLEGLKDFLPDKKTRLRLSSFKHLEDFSYLTYWEAAAIRYGSHSSKNITPIFKIKPVENHSMNNPIVEKIVNETIQIVNQIYNTYGFDEVRIELSRELKSSMDERQQMWEAMNNGAAKNEWAKQMLRELKSEFAELDTDPYNKNNLDKMKIIEDVVKYKEANEYKIKAKEYKLAEPSKAEIKKYLLWLEQNFRCPYTNQPIPFTDVFAKGKIVEIEHIIPRERYYLNSYANKVITWREVNQAKADYGNRTAYEFIVSKRKDEIIRLSNGIEVRLIAKENWENHVKSMFAKGSKQANLLRKEIPEDPINRTLKETQYINKKLKEKLGELVGDKKVWITSGAVTDILRERWHLNNKVFRELVRPRFENFNTGEKKEKSSLVYWTKQYNPKTNNEEEIEMFAGYSKRIDHRHHALDAVIIACTKQNHIQYINTLNAINSVDQEKDENKKAKYQFIKQDICVGNSSKHFKTPWEANKFIPDVINALNNIIVSHKNVRLLISPSKHRVNKNIMPAKIASIRGELHKETNYASKKYFEHGRMDTAKLIPHLLKVKNDNQFQTMVHFKHFKEIIKEIVLKEKYQAVLISLFNPYNEIKLTNKLCKDIAEEILKKIETENLLTDAKTGRPLIWLSIYSEKDKSNRPNGLSMNLNDAKEIKSIANPRVKRLAEYRFNYVNKQKEDIDKLDIDKKEKDKLKREAESLCLFNNAIYEVRIKKAESIFEWKELKDITIEDFENISYAKEETTELVKSKIKELGLAIAKGSYFTNPIFTSNKPIQIKKTRQKSYYQALYEVTPKRYVQVEETFMTYFFKEKKENTITSSRKIKFLKFIDAVSIINHEKPNSIDYDKLIEKERTNEELLSGKEYELLFTLAKNDLVYLPETDLKKEEIEAIDWNNKSAIAPYLYIVKDMNPSLSKIVFQQFYKSDSIKLSESDAKIIFNNPDLKEQIEEIKYGTVPMLQRCIKVFTDKLGKKVVPYWEFPNGCWNKNRAEELELSKA